MYTFQDLLSDLVQFQATEKHLKMIETAFYFPIKALFFIKLLNLFMHKSYRNHAKNKVQKIVPEQFLKNQSSAYSPKFTKVEH